MTVAFPEVIEDTRIQEVTETDKPWRVIVSNDPVNLISFVAVIFQKVFEVSEETAMKWTLKVHNEGRCAVFWGTQEKCQEKAEVLMSFQLWTHIEKV